MCRIWVHGLAHLITSSFISWIHIYCLLPT
jgi:hypothetical protein